MGGKAVKFKYPIHFSFIKSGTSISYIWLDLLNGGKGELVVIAIVMSVCVFGDTLLEKAVFNI